MEFLNGPYLSIAIMTLYLAITMYVGLYGAGSRRRTRSAIYSAAGRSPAG